MACSYPLAYGLFLRPPVLPSPFLKQNTLVCKSLALENKTLPFSSECGVLRMVEFIEMREGAGSWAFSVWLNTAFVRNNRGWSWVGGDWSDLGYQTALLRGPLFLETSAHQEVLIRAGLEHGFGCQPLYPPPPLPASQGSRLTKARAAYPHLQS